MKAIIFGKRSEIGINLAARLAKDGWEVSFDVWASWNLLVVCIGTLEPIGEFLGCDQDAWWDGVESNGLVPLRIFRSLYPFRMPGASCCVFGGPNLLKPSPTYSAYRVGKVVLSEMVPILNEETDVHTFMINPGVVNTKIHQQTLRAGNRAANYERVKGIVEGREPTTSHDEIYACLKWCMANKPERAVHVHEFRAETP